MTKRESKGNTSRQTMEALAAGEGESASATTDDGGSDDDPDPYTTPPRATHGMDCKQNRIDYELASSDVWFKTLNVLILKIVELFFCRRLLNCFSSSAEGLRSPFSIMYRYFSVQISSHNWMRLNPADSRNTLITLPIWLICSTSFH